MDRLEPVNPKALPNEISARQNQIGAIENVIGAVALVAMAVGTTLLLSRMGLPMQGWKTLAIIIPAAVAGALAYGLVLVGGAAIRNRIEENFRKKAEALKAFAADLELSEVDLKSAIAEHGSTVDPATLSLPPQSLDPRKFVAHDLTDGGRGRHTNQDAHIDQVLSNGGRIWGVFDGHGDDGFTNWGGPDYGLQAAQGAAELFPRFMEEELKQGHPPRIAFERVADRLQQLFDKEFAPLRNVGAGTTALICYALPNSNIVYTATIGDSESYLYREIDGELQAIPLSVVRDWSCKEEQDRLDAILPGGGERLREKVASGTAKPRPSPVMPNVSRSLGDFDTRYADEKEMISHKPTVTAVRVQPGDLLLLGCDGVWDYAKPTGALEAVKANFHDSPQAIATAVKDRSIEEMEEISIDTQYKRYVKNRQSSQQPVQTRAEFVAEQGDPIKNSVGDNITVMAVRV